MNRHKTSLILFVIVVFLIFYSCEKETDKQKGIQLRFISEEYKPFNYFEDGNPTGLAPELLKEICSQLNINYQIEFMNWEEGVNQTLENDNTVLFSTALNSTRKDQFKWAGPIASLDWVFYASPENPVQLEDIEDAKSVGAIGVVSGYAMEEFLLEQGFANLVYCTNINEALSKLLDGEIDLFPSDKYTTKSALEAMGQTEYAVRALINIKTELLYFAFNKSVSDVVVADFQKAIDNLKMDGTLKQLTWQFLNTGIYPDVLQVYTEAYPPLTFLDKNGEVTGYGTDIAREIMKRNGQYYPVRLSAWNNGYQLALNNPDFCLYTMDRTDIREGLFQWVGPIGTNTTWFYTRAGSGITINSTEDAKGLPAVGVISSWFSAQYLEEQGYTNLVYENDPQIMAQELLDGQVDAFVCTDITFPDILREMGYSYNEVIPSFELMSSDFYIAFSTETSTEIVDRWQQALDALIEDGTYKAIQAKWFPDMYKTVL